MTDEQKRLLQKLERLMAKRASAPSVTLEAEIKATADRIALLEAVRQRAVEEPEGPVIAEWIETPREDGPPQIVDLRSRPPDAA